MHDVKTAILKMYRAQVIAPGDAPELYEMVDRLRQRAGLPMPVVAIATHPPTEERVARLEAMAAGR